MMSWREGRSGVGVRSLREGWKDVWRGHGESWSDVMERGLE